MYKNIVLIILMPYIQLKTFNCLNFATEFKSPLKIFPFLYRYHDHK